MFTQFKASTIACIVPLVAAVLLPIVAHASPQCTKEPKSAWLSEAAMKEKIATMGYHDIKVFKTSGNCYEIYGRDAQGHKAEVYSNLLTEASSGPTSIESQEQRHERTIECLTGIADHGQCDRLDDGPRSLLRQ